MIDEPAHITAEREAMHEQYETGAIGPNGSGSPSASPADAGIELPPGVELWGPGMCPPRPVPAEAMFHGPIGQMAVACANHSEADPAAILAQSLALFGASCGRGPHVRAGNDRHPAALHVLVVGNSAKGGKGTSWAASRSMMRRVDDEMVAKRVMNGFGSGEAVIAELAPDPTTGRVTDERLIVYEAEFGGVLAKCHRDASTLGPVLRGSWDGVPLSNRTRGAGKLVAENYHLASIGHVTADELVERVDRVDIYGGTLNRLLHVWAERGELRPDGGNVPDAVFAPCVAALRSSVEAARKTGEVTRTPDANERWHALYEELARDDPPGVLGHVISRAAPQALRLSLAYALADHSRTIGVAHVDAAGAFWAYSRATAALIYGQTTGDPHADRLLAALRQAGPVGMNGRQVNAELNNRTDAVKRARDLLVREGLAVVRKVPSTGGRPPEVTFAVRPARTP
jgi:hypothetical protein